MAWLSSADHTCLDKVLTGTRKDKRHTFAAMAVLTLDDSFDASDELRFQNIHTAMSAEIPARTKRMGQAMPRYECLAMNSTDIQKICMVLVYMVYLTILLCAISMFGEWG